MTSGSRGMVPHHGPVGPDCPVECLLTVLSKNSSDRLTRADGAPFREPRTVGDVLDLHARRQLGKIRGIGSRHLSEIEAALVFAGLQLPPARREP